MAASEDVPLEFHQEREKDMWRWASTQTLLHAPLRAADAAGDVAGGHPRAGAGGDLPHGRRGAAPGQRGVRGRGRGVVAGRAGGPRAGAPGGRREAARRARGRPRARAYDAHAPHHRRCARLCLAGPCPCAALLSKALLSLPSSDAGWRHADLVLCICKPYTHASGAPECSCCSTIKCTNAPVVRQSVLGVLLGSACSGDKALFVLL